MHKREMQPHWSVTQLNNVYLFSIVKNKQTKLIKSAIFKIMVINQQNRQLHVYLEISRHHYYNNGLIGLIG